MLPVALSAAVLAACGKNVASTDRAMSDDLKRDLQLASSASLDLASKQSSAAFPLTEVAPPSTGQAPTPALKRGAGPKAVRSSAPTVKAAPDASVAVEAENPEIAVMEQAPSPTTEQVPDVNAPAVPRPSPIPVMAGGEGAIGRGGSGPRDNGGMGGGSVLGGIFGVIIRGGGVDGDRCEIHDRRGRRTGNGGYGSPNTPNPMGGPASPRGPGIGGGMTRRGRS